MSTMRRLAPFFDKVALSCCAYSSFVMPVPSNDTETRVAQQLDNMANLAERVASPEFKRSFRAGVVARAKAAGSYVAYFDKAGRLVREWPTTGKLEVVASALP